MNLSTLNSNLPEAEFLFSYDSVTTMAKVSSINIELLKVYNVLAEQINVSAHLASILHKVRDIKASGNEIEGSLRSVLSGLLPLKYKVSHGHIIDNRLNVSKQYDLIIAENIDFTKIITTGDKTEIFLYETIYGLGEVKATWNKKNLIETVESIKDIKNRLKRKTIEKNVIISGAHQIQLSQDLTSNPIRNPLFSFAFTIKSDGKFKELASFYNDKVNWPFLPNITVILNAGIIALVNLRELEKGNNIIHLYPEYAGPEYEWRFISTKEPGAALAYLVFCLLEHLSTTLLEIPSIMEYSGSILDINDSQISSLNEL